MLPKESKKCDKMNFPWRTKLLKKIWNWCHKCHPCGEGNVVFQAAVSIM